MQLFDQMHRDYLGPAGQAEPEFAYLNRSARRLSARIRLLFEEWFTWFPDGADKDLLRDRFRSSADEHHWGASFELYCYALLRAQGFDVQIHPVIQETNRVPDYLALREGNPLFFLEATIATAPNMGHERVLGVVQDNLNRLDSPNFFIGWGVKMSRLHAPSVSSMRRFIEAHLQNLDPDEVARSVESSGPRALPRWLWQEDGWEIEFFPIPKSAKSRGVPNLRPVGIGPVRVRWGVPGERLRETLRDKAGRYGKLSLPYVVAVNMLDWMFTEDEIADALFGTERWVVDLSSDSATPTRSLDGLWTSPQGPINRRLSGVLIATHMWPGDFARKAPVLWHNPWATKPLNPGEWHGSQRVADLGTRKMREVEGEAGWQILGLQPDWPGEDD